MIFADTEISDICVGDTIFIEKVIHTQKEHYLMVSTWQMLHHHECSNVDDSEKEKYVTGGSLRDSTGNNNDKVPRKN